MVFDFFSKSSKTHFLSFCVQNAQNRDFWVICHVFGHVSREGHFVTLPYVGR